MLFALLLAAEQQQEGSPFSMLFPFMVILVLGYFLLFRPMQRQEKQRREIIAALKKGDKIVTSAGIIGVVVAIKDKEDEVSLRIDDNANVRLRVTKSSIARVLGGEEAAKEDKEGTS
jgi:preprotein translocase subunit YajC